MECMVHYSRLKSYSKLKPVFSINKEAILKPTVQQHTNICWQRKASASSGMLLDIHASQQQETRGKESNKKVF